MSLPPFAAYVQLDTVQPAKTLETLRSQLVNLAPPAGAIIALPELWSHGISFHQLADQATEAQNLLTDLQDIAGLHGCLLMGSLPELHGQELHNTLFLIDGSGVVGRYQKHQLFAPMAEPDHFQPAPLLQPLSGTYPALAGLVCFDLRFPELARQQMNWGAKLLVVVAQWPLARVQHWRTLLMARAIENQCYVLACNRVGQQQGIDFAGNSMIIGPDGTILAEAGQQHEVDGVALDAGLLSEVRGRFNTIAPTPYKRPDQDKVVELSQLQALLQQQKGIGRRLVFTNGCFDILHEGHVTYLEAARRQGDLLVVGLNNDASIRSIKGPDRPMNNESSRARVLAALGCVDYVVLFGEDTPLNLISSLEPDVLVKGADWPIDQIVGAEEVLARGGQVKTIEFVGDFSTTGLIAKIRDK